MRGEINLSIKLGNAARMETFLVSDQIDTDFLIGMDILKSYDININMAKQIIKLDGKTHQCRVKPKSIPNSSKVKLHRTTTIPPNSAKTLTGIINIPNHLRNKSYEGIIEPFINLTRKLKILVTGSLSYSNKHLVSVHCINPTNEPTVIYKNQLVAFFKPVHHEGSDNLKSIKRVTNHGEFYDSSIDITRLPDACTVEETIDNGRWDDVNKLISELGIDNLTHVPNLYREQLKDLVSEYSHVFSKNRFDLGCASFYESRLHLKNDYRPKWVPSRPPAYKIKPHLDKEISNLCESGQISPCNYSLWNSAVFMVPKSDSSWRFVVDARAVNKECIQDNYELPKINTMFDNLSETEVLSSLDFVSSFTQIPLKKEFRPITAFTYGGKRYQFNRMIMGQTSSSAEFSRCMSILFSKIPFKALLIYIDDLLVCSNTYPEHIRRLRFVFERLTFGNLKLSPKKTKLFQKEVKFLGHTISKNGISVDPHKLKAIKNLPAPTSVKQVQKFLGMLNYHRNFIRNFADIAGPLYDLTGKPKSFNWSNQCQISFDNLKNALTKSPILSVPNLSDSSHKFTLTLDASKTGLGAVLSQYNPKTNQQNIISYYSRRVPKHLQKWGATRLEFLALHSSILHWRLYLQANHFRVLTDCKALTSLDTIFGKDNAYMQRRIADLSGYKFSVEHVSGKSEEIQIPDYLSRYSFGIQEKSVATQTDNQHVKLIKQNKIISDSESNSDCTHNIDSIFSKIRHVCEKQDKLGEPISSREIREEYQNDSIINEVINWIDSTELPKLNPNQCHKELWYYYRNFEFLRLQDGILQMKIFSNSDPHKYHFATILPQTLIKRALYLYHDTIQSCHMGVQKTYQQISKHYFFYKIKEEIKLYVSACVTCQRTKPTSKFLKAPLKPQIYHHFNQCIQIDHLEPTKKPTPRGHVALLTIVDMYSSYLVCVPVRSTSANNTINVLIKHWFCKFGIPSKITHDQGSGFESTLFKETCKSFGIHNVRSTPWKSSTQGRVESCHKRINACFRAILNNQNFHKYDLYIDWIIFTLNCLQSNRTGFSPNFLVFGQEARTPRDFFVPDNSPDYQNVYDSYSHAKHIARQVSSQSETKSRYMANQYDKNVRGPFFEKGDYCMLLVNIRNHKYSHKWTGPHVILEKINDHNYIINFNGIEKVVSISKLKHYPNKNNKYSQSITDNLITSTKHHVKGNQSNSGNAGDDSDVSWYPNLDRSRSRNGNCIPVMDNTEANSENTHIHTSRDTPHHQLDSINSQHSNMDSQSHDSINNANDDNTQSQENIPTSRPSATSQSLHMDDEPPNADSQHHSGRPETPILELGTESSENSPQVPELKTAEISSITVSSNNIEKSPSQEFHTPVSTPTVEESGNQGVRQRSFSESSVPTTPQISVVTKRPRPEVPRELRPNPKKTQLFQSSITSSNKSKKSKGLKKVSSGSSKNEETNPQSSEGSTSGHKYPLRSKKESIKKSK